MPEKLTYKTDAERINWCRARGIEPDDHCCLDMAWFISDPHEIAHQGPNPVILYIASHRVFRIDISRRGYQSTPINYCPWCGAKLPVSLEDEWHKTLVALGYGDPGNDDIPDEFNSAVWWKSRRL